MASYHEDENLCSEFVLVLFMRALRKIDCLRALGAESRWEISGKKSVRKD